MSLTDKVFKISHPQFHEKNYKIIIKILIENDYPLSFIFKVIDDRIHKLIFSTLNPVNFLPSSSSSCPFTSVLSSTPSYFVIPFVKNISSKFRPLSLQLNKNLAFFILNKLNIFIKVHKDSLSNEHKTNVVYKINCLDCDASYIGQTKRQLITRIKEHRSNINNPSANLTVVTEHRLEGHEFDWDNVSILDSEPHYTKRLISEMLHIKNQLNSINIKENIELLDSSYFPILNKLT